MTNDATHQSMLALLKDDAYATSFQSLAQYRKALVRTIEGDAKLIEKCGVYDQIQRACGQLPEGWQVHIELERDAGVVFLSNPDGDNVDYPSNHEFLSESISDAIDEALSSASSQS